MKPADLRISSGYRLDGPLSIPRVRVEIGSEVEYWSPEQAERVAVELERQVRARNARPEYGRNVAFYSERLKRHLTLSAEQGKTLALILHGEAWSIRRQPTQQLVPFVGRKGTLL